MALPDVTTADPTSATADPTSAAAQAAESRQREASRLSRREGIVEFACGGGFLVAAVALALASHSLAGVSWPRAAVTVMALAVASRVIFDVGSSYTMPTQLVFVPMLFLLPPGAVPLLVAAGLTAAKLPEALIGRRQPGRVLLAIGDSWFALGPAVVLTLAGARAPDGHDWPLYVAALAAQFGLDFAASSTREWLNGGARVREQLDESGWVYLVDALLSPVALAVAFAAVVRPWLVTLMLPLAALLLIFARERRARIDYALELGRAYRGTALVLGNVVEADDAYTGVHCEGVVALAVEVADDLRLGRAARRNVEFGALLHDVGKIVVPKEIINKPGPLDDEEWEIIRTHTIEGQRLLDKVGGFMREVGRIVRSSHERFDGRGYPDGLAGADIPLEARIVACCDAYDAMTTDRPYRLARSTGAALGELRRCAGSQFDPRVVEAVTGVVDRRAARAGGAPDAPEAMLPDPGRLARRG